MFRYIDEAIIPRKVFYCQTDYSFDTKLWRAMASGDLIFNNLTLKVDLEYRVFQVWGYSPYSGWISTSLSLPEAKSGVLQLIDEEYRDTESYSINDRLWPEYVDIDIGWICIGDPQASGEAINFLEGAIAVLEEGQLQALWLQTTGYDPTLPERFSWKQHIVYFIRRLLDKRPTK